MNRLSLLIFFLSFCYLKSISQSNRPSDTLNVFENIKKELIELSIKSDIKSSTFLFSKINVLDKRYDSVTVGYIRYDNPKKEYRKILTKNTLSNHLQFLLTTLYSKSFNPHNIELLIVIRNFWFEKYYDFSDSKFSISPSTYFLTFGFDIYYFSENQYIPIIKKDTTIELPQKTKEPEKGMIIGESLKETLDDLFPSLPGNIPLGKRKLSFSEVNEYYDKKFRNGILVDPEFKKGVYMNFDEFKRNAPTYSDFEIRETKLADDIYLINGPSEAPLRNVWGYSDGKNAFIKLGMNFFQLYRQGNSFSLLGNDNLSHKYNRFRPAYNDNASQGENLGASALGNILFSKDKFKLYLIPLKLNMETGKVY